MEKKKIFITVKTYPFLSKHKGELVCTAGITEDFKFIRIYPIEFRSLEEYEKFKKYQWIEAEVYPTDARNDKRPESFKVNSGTLRVLEGVSTIGDEAWLKRRDLIPKPYTNLKEIIDRSKKNELSLCFFRPSSILDFTIYDTDPDYTDEQIEYFKKNDLFVIDKRQKKITDVVRKLPYKFKYVFLDDQGKESELIIADWEIGALYWNLRDSGKYENEDQICQKIREKYFEELAKNKDIHFFLGTNNRNHNMKTTNPFMISGVFYPGYVQTPDSDNLFEN